MSNAALKNTLETIASDDLYKYDEAKHKALCNERPWKV